MPSRIGLLIVSVGLSVQGLCWAKGTDVPMRIRRLATALASNEAERTALVEHLRLLRRLRPTEKQLFEQAKWLLEELRSGTFVASFNAEVAKHSNRELRVRSARTIDTPHREIAPTERDFVHVMMSSFRLPDGVTQAEKDEIRWLAADLWRRAEAGKVKNLVAEIAKIGRYARRISSQHRELLR